MLAMTEHSICHPGRPSPHGLDHRGSPAFELFHNAKSTFVRLPAPIDKLPSPSANNFSASPALEGLSFA
jgi:hypothetical protein